MPTLMQERAAQLLAENGGKYNSMGEVLKDAGYAKNMVLNPKRATKSLGFIELMDKMGLTDGFLLKKHKKLLNSRDQKIQTKNLELAYKVKGRLKDKEQDIGQGNIQINVIVGGNKPQEKADVIDIDANTK